jgi:hypothetical protein
LLDKIGKNGIDIDDTKCITAEQVEFLLSEPIAVLTERGRKNCPDSAAVNDVSQRVVCARNPRKRVATESMAASWSWTNRNVLGGYTPL